MTFRVGVIGHPVAHSISPRFQQAGLNAAGIDACYQAWDLQPSALEPFINELRSDDSLGANVTIPYKEAALRHMDGLHQTARFVGAINTIVNNDGHLQGYNTDVTGFQRSLSEAGFDPRGARATLWGAGGAARAVAWGLIWRGVESLTIVNRTTVRAGRLRHDLAAASADVSLRSMGADEEDAVGALANADLVVQCTSVGLRGGESEGQSPFAVDHLAADAFVVDLIANPVETRLVRAVRESGRRAIGGLPMLVYQGAASFELWTEREAPVEIMLNAAAEAMSEAAL
ncbi:MAG: shikimate dehydrogenase [Chloroflexi bacterium]|nr:shikimate dehydrogenase [Chloroflexota bacterium]MYF81764.1 shikimate dehydrogenase [Chloroflexota bacterium]MYI04883.1 shikimate dehydrogenase [Chloroflexota bacterium]